MLFSKKILRGKGLSSLTFLRPNKIFLQQKNLSTFFKLCFCDGMKSMQNEHQESDWFIDVNVFKQSKLSIS